MILEKNMNMKIVKRRRFHIYQDRAVHRVVMYTCRNYAYVDFWNERIHIFNIMSGLHQNLLAAASLITSAISTLQGPSGNNSLLTSLSADEYGDRLASATISEIKANMKLLNTYTPINDSNTAGDPQHLNRDLHMTIHGPG